MTTCTTPKGERFEIAVNWLSSMGYPDRPPMPCTESRLNLFAEWAMMNSRCYNPADPNYSTEGARGIGVQDEWNPALGGTFEEFENFMIHYFGPQLLVNSCDHEDDAPPCPDGCGLHGYNIEHHSVIIMVGKSQLD